MKFKPVKATLHNLARNGCIRTIAIYVFFLIALSIHYMLTILANVLFLMYLFTLVRSRHTIKNLNVILVSIAGANLIEFHIMPDSYAELLTWEVILHVFLYVSTFYYYYCLKRTHNASKSESISTLFDFRQQDNYFQCKE